MRRIARTIIGFALLFAGLLLALPFVPGPGIPLVIVGLVILAEHFDWARRLVDWAKRKLDIGGGSAPPGRQRG